MPRLRKLARISAAILRDGGAFRLARRAIRHDDAIQRAWELASLIRDVKRLRPQVVVEIGTHRGGTLRCWAAVAAPRAHLASIDIPTEAEGIGSYASDDARFRAFLRPGQTLTRILRDSHAPETLAALRDDLGGRAIDFLWIDGDHSDAGVRADWAMYAPLVRPGGLIAFHDIQRNPSMPGNQVHPLWRELRARYPHREYVDQDQPGGVGAGIGVIVQPPSAAAAA